MRGPTLVPVAAATLLLNAAAIIVAVANGWPAEFGAHNDPHRVSAQWVGSGTAISAPVAPLVALAVCTFLVATHRRRLAVVGAIGALVVGALAIIGEFGEPTFFHPVNAVEALFHAAGLLLAIAIVLAAGREAGRRFRRPVSATS